MAKRLTKARRPKRRWLGLLVDKRHKSRAEVEASISNVAQKTEASGTWRLMDYCPEEQRKTDAELTDLTALHPAHGLAILRVDLIDAPTIRMLLEDDEALATHGFESLTTSGKIQLVRRRLGLRRPRRLKK
tara:strand:+ start:320 stop:712 length:393 start_codon:yes stop_codon:yes gene_type:complete